MNILTLGKLTRRVGPANVARLLARRLRGAPADGLYSVQARGYPHPFTLRPHGSDPAVFRQVIRERGYDVLPPDREPAFIVDCGANVGFSSVFFLERYPNCRLVAVEPDPANFAVLERNLAAYGDRAKALNTGVWSHPARLKLSDDVFRDGREWARMVRECRPGEATQFTATDIGTILRESGEPRIGLLKIDVEKSEREIFARNYEGWLDKVDAIAIELHDDECESIFHAAVKQSNVPFEFRRVGELTVGKLINR
jgi:FkbM family methyltransferase